MRCIGFPLALILLGLAPLAAASTARADSGPVIVIPSRPGIPIVINGRDASYAVVEGDWGLARPGHMAVTVIGGSPLMPNEAYTRRDSYHPKYGKVPQRGRQEIEPPADRALPDPAETFSRSWSTSSEPEPVNDERPQSPNRVRSINPPGIDMAPATITDPQTFPQDFNPSDFVVPRRRRH